MGRKETPPAERFARAVAAEIRGIMARQTPRVSGLAMSKDPGIGRSQNYLATRLRGEKPFTLDELDRICAFLGVDSAKLIHRVNEELARSNREGEGDVQDQ